MPALENVKHEHFAQLVAEGVSATQAAIKVGYAEKGAHVRGSHLRNDSKIAVRIQELRDLVANRAVMTSGYNCAKAMAETDEALAIALRAGNASAAAAVITLRAKLNGLLVERQEVKAANPLDSMSPEQLAALVASLEKASKESDNLAVQPSQGNA